MMICRSFSLSRFRPPHLPFARATGTQPVARRRRQPPPPIPPPPSLSPCTPPHPGCAVVDGLTPSLPRTRSRYSSMFGPASLATTGLHISPLGGQLSTRRALCACVRVCARARVSCPPTSPSTSPLRSHCSSVRRAACAAGRSVVSPSRLPQSSPCPSTSSSSSSSPSSSSSCSSPECWTPHAVIERWA